MKNRFKLLLAVTLTSLALGTPVQAGSCGNKIHSYTVIGGGTTTFFYDAQGRQAKHVVSNGGSTTTTTYTYNPGNPATVTQTDTTGTTTTTTTYTLNDQGLAANNGNGVGYEYDSAGQLINETHPSAGFNIQQTWVAGDMTSQRRGPGNPAEFHYTYTHYENYDDGTYFRGRTAAAHWLATSTAIPGVYSYEADACGRVIKQTWPNGVVINYTYEDEGGNCWSLAGNGGTDASKDFLGTTDSQALELRANNSRMLRLEPNSFAAGPHAKVNNVGAFVWADAGPSDFSSSANNQFSVRATGGVRLVTGFLKIWPIHPPPGFTGEIGACLHKGSGTWSSCSDRNVKTDFAAVDGRQVLDRLAGIPLTTWSYITQDKSIKHIGPMAQDFAAAFHVGEDDTHISTVDADGVALAAIQGLNQKVEEKDAEIQNLKARLEKLEHLMGQKN